MHRSLLALPALFVVGSANAGVIYSQDYQGFNGDAGTLSDHTVTGMSSAADLNRGTSTGGVTTGGVYNFQTGGSNDTLGIQPGGSDWTPGTIEITFTSTEAFTSLDIDFDVWVLNNEARGNSFELTDVVIDTVSNPTTIGLAASPDAADGSPAWASTSYNGSITAAGSIGSTITLVFSGDDVSGSTNRDEFGLDNIVITAVPEPASVALLGAGALCMLRRRR